MWFPPIPNLGRVTPLCLFVASIGCSAPETRDVEDVKISVNTAALTNATEARNAVGLLPSDVISIDFGTSDQTGLAVFNTVVGSFPTQGSSYFVMSSGDTASALTANTSPSTSTELNGLTHARGQDLVQATFTLRPPAGASCLAVDFAFYSEEYPEWVHSQYNDAFIIEVGQSTFQIDESNQVIAPNNFAFDTSDSVISINTTFGADAANASGTTYDGATGLLTAKTPLENPGATIAVTLSIMDLGDSVYDSTAFVDNFRWLYGVACEPGADTDSDRDSLLDAWETEGIDFNHDGVVDLDLPAMGATPDHKDIFIEVDYMVDPGGPGLTGHTHKPKLEALRRVIDAFANAPVDNPDGTQGIHAHIDAGSDTIANPVTLETWGAASNSDALAHQANLGTCPGGNYDWSAVDAIKGVGTPGSFSIRRGDIFHYCIFGHSLCPDYTTTSGISRGFPASDFIVSLGGWMDDVGSVGQQAGTLLHELGHNLSFRHGGDNHGNFKPNYLSIMNYAFQTRGLRIGGLDGTYDYSRFTLPALDEGHLNETLGLAGVSEAAGYGTRFYDSTRTMRVVNDVNVAIDWNWDGNATATDVSIDVNNGGGTMHVGSDNWAEIVFNGGAVGHLGENIVLPVTVPDPDHALVDIDRVGDSVIPTDYAVGTAGPAVVILAAGKSAVVQYTVTNRGLGAATFAISATSPEGWANLSNVPAGATLAPNRSITIPILVTVPAGSSAGVPGSLKVSASSTANPRVMDSGTTSILVSSVAIDVKPGSGNNPINNNSNGVVPVALLGSPAFDVRTVRASSLAFGPGAAPFANQPSLEDVNRDGILDLVTHYRVQVAGVGASSVAYACLWGETVDGTKFGDCDPVTHP